MQKLLALIAILLLAASTAEAIGITQGQIFEEQKPANIDNGVVDMVHTIFDALNKLNDDSKQESTVEQYLKSGVHAGKKHVDIKKTAKVHVESRQEGPPRPEMFSRGTNFLDHETPIKDFFGKTFLRDNIPYIDIPDAKISALYYYRWSTLQRHLRYTTAGTGYILTEFVQPVGYAGAFGTIDAAAGHQIDEARWLRNQVYSNDYIQIYSRGPADYKQYTHWIQDAAYRKSQVDGDTATLVSQLADLIKMWDAWEYTKNQTVGLYYFTPLWDAQERSLPGYVHPDPSSSDPYFVGPDTYRPNVNAYMVANARGIASTATLAGRTDIADNFTKIAQSIEDAMLARLWDPNQQFFVDVIKPDNPNLNFIDGRELVGLFPFRFGIGLDKKYTAPSVAQLFDPQGFYAEFGPTTLEIRNKWFTPETPGCCYWQGQSWPYSTAHVLKSLAAIHRVDNTTVTAEQYYEYLSIYTKTQTKNGQPYIAESHNPMKDAWSGDSFNHSEHYDHSTNNDDVITGLLGIVPSSDIKKVHIDPIVPENWTYFAIENVGYHNHLISYFWDADGSRYGFGTGLTVFVDGNQAYHGDSPRANVSLSPFFRQTKAGLANVNIAANANGQGYPLIEATYTFTADSPYKTVDGAIFYDASPDNRWTNWQSPNNADTLKVTFARPRKFSSVTLHIFVDIDRKGGVDLPSEITIAGANGNITTISGDKLVANDINNFTFPEVESNFVAVTLSKRNGAAVGVCEFEVWVAPSTGPSYFAVDAVLTKANVVFDQQSSATSNGAVVGGLSGDSLVSFSGIYAETAGKQKLSVSYSNAGTDDVSVALKVNQVGAGSINLTATGGFYGTKDIEVDLAAGKNFVTLVGGNQNVRFETITLSSL